MPESPRLVLVGSFSSDNTQILVDVTNLGSAVATRIQLTDNYSTLDPPGMLTRPGFTGAPAASLDYPRVIPSGAVLSLFAAEAAALIAAGKALAHA